jgi:hypothetical protein
LAQIKHAPCHPSLEMTTAGSGDGQVRHSPLQKAISSCEKGEAGPALRPALQMEFCPPLRTFPAIVLAVDYSLLLLR